MSKPELKKTALCSAVLLSLQSMIADATIQDHRPLTWNMQGAGASTGASKWASNISGLVRNHDVVALQEAGPQSSLPSTAAPTGSTWTFNDDGQAYTVVEYQWNIATTAGTVTRWLYYMRTDFSTGNRVNLAMVTADRQQGIHFVPRQQPVNDRQNTSPRPAFGVRLADGTVFYTMHALAMSGGYGAINDANNVVEWVSDRWRNTTTDWAILGDFNQEPWATAEVISDPDFPNLNLFRSFQATYMGDTHGEYDYMVTRITAAQPIPWLGVPIGAGSDHAAVEFRLGGGTGAVPELARNTNDSTALMLYSTDNNYEACRVQSTLGTWSTLFEQSSPNPPLASMTVVTGTTGVPLVLSQAFSGYVHKTVSALECNFADDQLFDENEPYQSEIAAAKNNSGVLNIVATGFDGAIYTSKQTSAGALPAWTRELGTTQTLRRPTLLLGADGKLYLFGVKDNGTLRRAAKSNNNWSSLVTVAGDPPNIEMVRSGLANGYMHLFALDRHGALWHQRGNSNGTWTTWNTGSDAALPVGLRFAPPLRSISISTDSAGSLYLFGVSFSSTVYVNVLQAPGGQWGGWQTLYAPSSSILGIESERMPDGRVQAVIPFEDGSMYVATQTMLGGDFTVGTFCNGRCLNAEYFVSVGNPGTALSLPVNGQATNRAKVVLRDNASNRVSGVAVKFVVQTANNSQAAFTTPEGITDATGTFASDITGVAGTTAVIRVLFDNVGDSTPSTAVVNGAPATVHFATGG